MGYRSEVRCLIWGSPDDMTAFVTAKQLIDNHPALTHFKNDLTMYIVEASIHWDPETKAYKKETLQILDLKGDHWKWYDSYPDVIAWHDLMDKAEKAGLDYHFLRIGEGDGTDQDIDQQCTDEGYPFLGFSRPTVMEDIPEPERTIELL